MDTVAPALAELIRNLEDPSSNNPTLSVLCAIFLFLILKEMAGHLFQFKPPRPRLVSQQEIDNEVQLLIKEIRNLKSSLKKIIDEAQQAPRSQAAAGYDPSDVEQLMQSYQKTADDFNNLAEFILDSQECILREMKQIKRSRVIGERTPSHNSHNSHNSRSDTSEAPRDVDLPKLEVETSEPSEEVKPEQRPAPKVFKAPAPVARKRGVPPPPIPHR